MGYREEYEKAKEKSKVEIITRQIVSWEEEGQLLIGQFIRTEPFTEGEFDTEVLSYIIDTDDGIITTVLGSATDKQLEKVDLRNRNICIEYQGKKELGESKRCNLFKVTVW